MGEDIAARARRRTTALVAAAAAVLVVLAAAAALVAAVTHGRGTGSSRPAASAPPPADRPARPSPAGPAAREPAGDDLTWTAVAGARVPVSRSAGPRALTGGRARGFAATPLGAVLAAVHISVRLSPQVGPAVFEATLREQVVGADAAALGQQLAEDYDRARAQLGLPYGPPAGRLYATARGYRVDQAAPDAVSLRLLIEGPGQGGGSVLVAVALRLRWVGGDWALVAPPAGSWDAAAVTDPTGYTRFPDGG